MIIIIKCVSIGSGSDAASLSTTARKDGDCYVLNGSKVTFKIGSLIELIWDNLYLWAYLSFHGLQLKLQRISHVLLSQQ